MGGDGADRGAFAVLTTVGPIVVTLGGTHGIHLGDLVVLAAGAVVAAGTTATLSRDAR